jgi:hypothetical protein
MKELNVHCDCHSRDHQFYIWYDPDERPQCDWITFDMHLSTWCGFFRRLWIGLKYAFGFESKYGAWDEVLVDAASAREIVEFIEGYLARLDTDVT